jgi:ribosomal protein S18 acetylase RimI-like enzyme
MSTEIRELTRAEVDGAAAVVSRGMRDNPLHLRAFGPSEQRREAALARLFRALLSQYLSKGRILGAFSSRTLVGVCGMVESGRCQPGPVEKLRLAVALVRGGGLCATARALSWSGRWARHDPPERHWHLGPVAVDRPLQGRGIGGALLSSFGEAMDRERSMAYLETDKRENVPFYERFGFRVTAEDAVLGVANWFMVRRSGD